MSLLVPSPRGPHDRCKIGKFRPEHQGFERGGRISHQNSGIPSPPRFRLLDRFAHESASSAHIYFTYPFTLSWSLLEAMSTGCLVVGSDTAPLRDVINERNGILVPFFDIEKLADCIIDALAHPDRFQHLRSAARRTIVQQYDLAQKCLPALAEFVRRGKPPSLLDKVG
jgi:glycosyltransferase involved in cell wall biosynthesis